MDSSIREGLCDRRVPIKYIMFVVLGFGSIIAAIQLTTGIQFRPATDSSLAMAGFLSANRPQWALATAPKSILATTGKAPSRYDGRTCEFAGCPAGLPFVYYITPYRNRAFLYKRLLSSLQHDLVVDAPLPLACVCAVVANFDDTVVGPSVDEALDVWNSSVHHIRLRGKFSAAFARQSGVDAAVWTPRNQSLAMFFDADVMVFPGMLREALRHTVEGSTTYYPFIYGAPGHTLTADDNSAVTAMMSVADKRGGALGWLTWGFGMFAVYVTDLDRNQGLPDLALTHWGAEDRDAYLTLTQPKGRLLPVRLPCPYMVHIDHPHIHTWETTADGVATNGVSGGPAVASDFEPKAYEQFPLWYPSSALKVRDALVQKAQTIVLPTEMKRYCPPMVISYPHVLAAFQVARHSEPWKRFRPAYKAIDIISDAGYLTPPAPKKSTGRRGKPAAGPQTLATAPVTSAKNVRTKMPAEAKESAAGVSNTPAKGERVANAGTVPASASAAAQRQGKAAATAPAGSKGVLPRASVNSRVGTGKRRHQPGAFRSRSADDDDDVGDDDVFSEEDILAMMAEARKIVGAQKSGSIEADIIDAIEALVGPKQPTRGSWSSSSSSSSSTSLASVSFPRTPYDSQASLVHSVVVPSAQCSFRVLNRTVRGDAVPARSSIVSQKNEILQFWRANQRNDAPPAVSPISPAAGPGTGTGTGTGTDARSCTLDMASPIVKESRCLTVSSMLQRDPLAMTANRTGHCSPVSHRLRQHPSLDPLSEKCITTSPGAFCISNPPCVSKRTSFKSHFSPVTQPLTPTVLSLIWSFNDHVVEILPLHVKLWRSLEQDPGLAEQIELVLVADASLGVQLENELAHHIGNLSRLRVLVVTFLEKNSEQNLAQAGNTGAAVSSGRLLLFNSADTLPSVSDIREMVCRGKSGPTPFVAYSRGTSTSTSARDPSASSSAATVNNDGSPENRGRGLDDSFLISREAFLMSGGFHERHVSGLHNALLRECLQRLVDVEVSPFIFFRASLDQASAVTLPLKIEGSMPASRGKQVVISASEIPAAMATVAVSTRAYCNTDPVLQMPFRAVQVDLPSPKKV